MSSYKVSENDLLDSIAEDISQIDILMGTVNTIEMNINTMDTRVDVITDDITEITENIIVAKTDLSSAITDKSGTLYTKDNTFSELVVGINSIQTTSDGSMTGKSAETYPPSTAERIIKGGQYLEGDQTLSPVLGDATENDVLNGKVFSSSHGIDLVGKIISQPYVSYGPSIIDRTIPAGTYLSGDVVFRAVTGDANSTDVLPGKTFSSSYGINLSGNMPVHNQQTLNHTTTDPIVIEGKHYLNGDITINTPGGTAVHTDVLTGKTFTSDFGIGIIGTMRDLSSEETNITLSDTDTRRVYSKNTAAADGPVWYGTNSDGVTRLTAKNVGNGYVTADTLIGITDSLLASTIGITADKIRAGETVTGITGTFTNDATATADQILTGKTAYVNGNLIDGTMVDLSTTGDTTITYKGEVYPLHIGYLAGYDNVFMSKTANELDGGTYMVMRSPGSGYITEDTFVGIRENILAIILEIGPNKIASGKYALGMAGTFTDDADARASDIAIGKTAYVMGHLLEGTGIDLCSQNLIPGYQTYSIPKVFTTASTDTLALTDVTSSQQQYAAISGFPDDIRMIIISGAIGEISWDLYNRKAQYLRPIDGGDTLICSSSYITNDYTTAYVEFNISQFTTENEGKIAFTYEIDTKILTHHYNPFGMYSITYYSLRQ